MQSKNGFVFLASYYEALKELDPDTQLTLYTAIMEYALKGNEIELNGASKAIFTLIKPNIDSSLARYAKNTENGKQGGAPCGNKNAQKNNPNSTENNPNSTQTEIKSTQIQPKNNLEKDIDKEKEKDTEKERDIERIEGEKNVFLSLTSFKTLDIEKFKTAFPNKDVDLENLPPKPPPNFDMDTLISAINASTFLKTAQNMTLANCLKHYEKIISGAYQDFCRPPPQKETWERLYSAEELNNLFTRPEEIEI